MRLKILLWAGLILVAGSGTIFAADFGKGDVFVQGGGYTEFGEGGGTWAMVGGGASFHFGNHVSVFGELNYAHPTTKTTYYGVFAPGSANLFEAGSGNLFETGGGARIFIPFRNHRLRPYIPVVGGWLHTSASVALLSGGFVTVGTFVELFASPSNSDNGGYGGIGFGTEIGITRRFGLRPEFRFLREFYANSSDDNAMIFTVGAYYRFGK
jgi:hypothetical protein